MELQKLNGEEADCDKPATTELKEASEAGQQFKKLSRVRGIITAVIMLLCYTFLNAASSMIAPFYPIEALKQGVPTYIVGFVIGTSPLCASIASPVAGYLLPSLGLKYSQIAGLFLAAGSLILFGFVAMMPTPALFLTFSFLLMIVEGVGSAMSYTASYSYLTRQYPNKKGMLVGLIEFVISTGFMIGPPLGGGLHEVSGFTFPFVLVGGCTLILMLLLMLLLPSTGTTSEKIKWKHILKLFTNFMFIWLVLTLFLALSTGDAVLSYLGRFLYLQYNLRAGYIGAIYFAGAVSYVLSCLLAGVLTDKLIPKFLIITGLVVMSGYAFIGPAKFISSPMLWLSVLAWVISSAGEAFATVPVYSDAHAIAKEVLEGQTDEAVASILSGIVIAGYSAGECLGPIVGGALVYGVGFRWMTVICSLILLANALVLCTATAIRRLRRCAEIKCKRTGCPADHKADKSPQVFSCHTAPSVTFT